MVLTATTPVLRMAFNLARELLFTTPRLVAKTRYAPSVLVSIPLSTSSGIATAVTNFSRSSVLMLSPGMFTKGFPLECLLLGGISYVFTWYALPNSVKKISRSLVDARMKLTILSSSFFSITAIPFPPLICCLNISAGNRFT